MVDLLRRVDIECTKIGIGVDTSYDRGFTITNKATTNIGHSRVLSHIKDDKYNIDGFYISDPTWGNDLENNALLRANMTSEETESEKRLIYEENRTLITTSINFNDFNEKVNYILQKEINSILSSGKLTNIECVLKAYSIVLKYILDVIKNIDNKKYLEFKKIKYKNEKDYCDFLTNFGHYLIKKNNCPISRKTTYQADLRVHELQFKLNRKEKKFHLQATKNHNEQYLENAFDSKASLKHPKRK